MPDASRPDLTAERVASLNRVYPYTGAGLLPDTGELSIEECLARIDGYLS
jgi:hypothetical protein